MLEYSQQLQSQSNQQSGTDLQQPRSDLQPTNQNVQQGQQADPQAQGAMSQDQMTGLLQVQGVEPLQLSTSSMHTNQYGWLWLLLIPLILVAIMVKLMRDAGRVARGRDYQHQPSEQSADIASEVGEVAVAAEVTEQSDATPIKQKPKAAPKSKAKSRSKKKKR